MIAADTCVLVDYFQRHVSAVTEAVDTALARHELAVSPVVVTELLSARNRQPAEYEFINGLVLFDITPGYWQRAGELRAKVLRAGYKARLGDALIAQSCIDHDAPLLTADPDFRHYAKAGGLKLRRA